MLLLAAPQAISAVLAALQGVALVSGSCAESLCLFASPNLCCSSPAAKRGRTRKGVHGPLGRAKSIQMVGRRSDLRREPIGIEGLWVGQREVAVRHRSR
jgi:hypothetical protein